MLEHSRLLIHAWGHSPTPDGESAWTRTITDDAGQRLGFVRLTSDSARSWFSWLRGVQLDVFDGLGLGLSLDPRHLPRADRQLVVLAGVEVVELVDPVQHVRDELLQEQPKPILQVFCVGDRE